MADNFQTIETGKGILENSYDDPITEAMRRRVARLQNKRDAPIIAEEEDDNDH